MALSTHLLSPLALNRALQSMRSLTESTLMGGIGNSDLAFALSGTPDVLSGLVVVIMSN
jgi:hypothetical protein